MAMSGSLDRKMMSGDASTTAEAAATGSGGCCSVDPMDQCRSKAHDGLGLLLLRFVCARFGTFGTTYCLCRNGDDAVPHLVGNDKLL